MSLPFNTESINTKNNGNQMLKNFLLVISVSFFLAGCVSTPAENKDMLAVYDKEFSKYSSPLTYLKEANVAVNARRINYAPTFLISSTFGDLSFTKDRKRGHLNLLAPHFIDVLNSQKCGSKLSKSEEEASACYAGFYDYDMELTPKGTERAIENAEEALKSVYDSLAKLDEFISIVPKENRTFVGEILAKEFDEKYTMEQFSDAIESFVLAYSEAKLLAGVEALAKQRQEALLAAELQKIKDKEAEARRAKWAEEAKLRKERNRLFALEKEKEERAKLALWNSEREKVWKNRNSQTFGLGDKVCNYQNIMGFIEKVSEENIKIQTYGKAQGPKGRFFGNLPTYNSQILYEPMDKVIWAAKGDYASCDFST